MLKFLNILKNIFWIRYAVGKLLHVHQWRRKEQDSSTKQKKGCTFSSPVVDTGGKWKKSSIRKILIILLGHLWIVELTYIYIFAFKFTLRYLQPDINPIVCHRCRWYRWHLPPVWLTLEANLPPVSLTNNTSETGGKIFRRCRWYRWQICHRCRWYQWSTLSCEYLREFSKKFETALMVYSGAWGKLIHEKNQDQKISCHCPFKL